LFEVNIEETLSTFVTHSLYIYVSLYISFNLMNYLFDVISIRRYLYYFFFLFRHCFDDTFPALEMRVMTARPGRDVVPNCLCVTVPLLAVHDVCTLTSYCYATAVFLRRSNESTVTCSRALSSANQCLSCVKSNK